MLPLKSSTASYQFRCHDDAYLFSTVVDFISNLIFVSCQGKLRFEVSFIVLAVTMRCLQKSENCDSFRWKSASPNLTIRMVWTDEGSQARNSRTQTKEVLESTVSRLSRWTFMIFMLDVLFMQRKWFSPTIRTNKRKTLVISLSAHVITAFVQSSVRRSVCGAVINVRVQVARRIKNICCESAIDMSTASPEREREQVKRKHACSFN